MSWLRKNKGKTWLATIVMLWAMTFLSPELAVRRYMLLHLHPIDSFAATVTKTDFRDDKYGYLYDVRGYVDRATGDELGAF